MRKAARASSQEEDDGEKGLGGVGKVVVALGRSVVGGSESEKCVAMNVLVEPRPRIDGAGSGGTGPMSGERGGSEREVLSLSEVSSGDGERGCGLDDFD